MNKAKRYRTKSIEIEAMQFTDLDSYLDIVAWWKRVYTGTLVAAEIFEYRTPIMLLNARGGYEAASPGDWIIRDPEGEFRACRADVFDQAYEERRP